MIRILPNQTIEVATASWAGAQLVAVDGEIRQLVEVKLNVVQPGADRVIDGQLSAPSSPDLPQTERLEAISSDIKALQRYQRVPTKLDRMRHGQGLP